jgi:hypothetical protein
LGAGGHGPGKGGRPGGSHRGGLISGRHGQYERGTQASDKCDISGKHPGAKEKQGEARPSRRERVGSFFWAQNVEEELLDTTGFHERAEATANVDMLQEMLSQGKEADVIEMGGSPKRKKKIKIDKDGDRQRGRSLSSTRKTNMKSWK